MQLVGFWQIQGGQEVLGEEGDYQAETMFAHLCLRCPRFFGKNGLMNEDTERRKGEKASSCGKPLITETTTLGKSF